MAKSTSNKKVRIRCPKCLNFLMANVCNNGAISGNCSVCKSSIYSKQYSANETHIKIIKHSC